MHAVKGGWVGQTFALAKGNESTGRKSRIRRSKEERRGMVESFIKKYQRLNNGNFPSLNLTHKEVGGSFYTVREIVREIIQENRVLGPAKFLPEEQSTDLLLEQYPLGTMSTEPQTPLSILPSARPGSPDEKESANEESDLVFAAPQWQEFDNGEITNGSLAAIGSPFVPGLQENTSEASALVSSEPGQQAFDNGGIVNGSQLLGSNQESRGPKIVEVQVSEPQEAQTNVEVAAPAKSKQLEVQVHEPLETEKNVEVEASCKAKMEEALVKKSLKTEKNVEEVAASGKPNVVEVQASKPKETEKNVNQVTASRAKLAEIAEVLVETFPIRPVTQVTDACDGKSGKAGDLNGISAEKEFGKVLLGPGNGVNLSETPFLKDDKEVEKLGCPSLGRNYGLEDERAGENLAHLPLGSSDSTITNDGIVQDTGLDIKVVKFFHNDKPISETKFVNPPSGIESENLDGTHASVGGGKSTIQEKMVKNKEVLHSSGSRKGGNPTLNRINLESWERASERSPEPEANPLWVIFKSFIAAFVKFWSE